MDIYYVRVRLTRKIICGFCTKKNNKSRQMTDGVQDENLQLQQCSQVTQNLRPNQTFLFLYRPEPA